MNKLSSSLSSGSLASNGTCNNKPKKQVRFSKRVTAQDHPMDEDDLLSLDLWYSMKDCQDMLWRDVNALVEDGKVTDTTRIDRIVPTVQHILDAGGTPILVAHFGRPKGKVVPEMSLKVVLPALEKALAQTVKLTDLDAAKEAIAFAKNQPILLENIRFHPGEEMNDADLAARLADLCDVYCNDAFSAAHRAHASTCAVAQLRPSCAGLLMAAELSALEGA